MPSRSEKDERLEFRTRGMGYSWVTVGFLLFWSGGGTAAVIVAAGVHAARAFRATFGDGVVSPSGVDQEELRVFCAFAVIGPALLAASLFAVLRCRPQFVLDAQGVWLIQPLAPDRLFPYHAMRRVETTWLRSEHGPCRFIAHTDQGRFWFTRSLHGWPGMVAELWRRCPELVVEMPPALRTRIAAVRDDSTPEVSVDAQSGETLEYGFGAPFAVQLVICVFGLLAFSAVHIAGESPLDAWLFTHGFIGGTAAILTAIHIQSYAQFRIRIFRLGLQVRDHRGVEQFVPWSEVVDYHSITWRATAPFTLGIETPTGTVLVRREIRNYAGLTDALDAALARIDQELDGGAGHVSAGG